MTKEKCRWGYVTSDSDPKCQAYPPVPYGYIQGCWFYWPGRTYLLPDWHAHSEWLRNRSLCQPCHAHITQK